MPHFVSFCVSCRGNQLCFIADLLEILLIPTACFVCGPLHYFYSEDHLRILGIGLELACAR